MQLPNDEIGISDILSYRACAQQFAFGMRRHTPLPERFQLYSGEGDEPPENENYFSAYGHCVHDLVEMVETTGCDHETAIDAAWPKYQHWLDPDDLARLRSDLMTWEGRQIQGFRLVGAELELRVPLLVHNGRQIYYRGRIDALYQHLQNPAFFYARDYKSSRWPKAEAEVHKDLQQWSYNWAIHEYFPECARLIQLYDQFRFGSIPTQKTPEQRARLKDWLVRQVTAILNDDRLKPTSNDMCHFCPIMMDCRVTHMTGDYWANRLAALAPEKKVGRKIVVELTKEHAGYEVYAELLPRVKNALKVMERFVATVEGDLKEMDQTTRESLGYGLGRPRRLDTWDADAKRQILAELGDDAIHLMRVTKTDVEDFFGADSDEAKRIISMATKKESAPPLKALKRAA